MPKRIVLISVDDLRWDALSCEADTRYLDRYGLAGLRDTPLLDELAAGGTRWSQAIATASYTPASHASMLSGCYPPATGVRAFLANRISDGVPLLAEQLQAYGFHTVSAIDFGAMFSVLGLDRGFEERFSADDDALLAHLAERSREALFCFVHLVDVHPPVSESFDPPWEGYNDDFYKGLDALARELGVPHEPLDAPFENLGARRRAAVALSGRLRMIAEERRIVDAVELPRYLAGVNKFDQGRLRKLVGGLRELFGDDLLLAVTSDHGQGAMPDWTMGDPHVPLKFDHGEVVREETIRVPLILHGPGVDAGGVVGEQVSLVDVAPTLLAWAGADVPEEVQGRSLLDADGGSTAYAEVWYHDRAALSAYLRRSLEHGGLAPDGYATFLNQRVIRTPRYKYSRRGAELDGRDLDAPDADFVRAVFTKLLARQPEREEVGELTHLLRTGAIGREDLARDVGARHGHREALYDLQADPWEEVDLLSVALGLRTVGREHDAPAIAAVLAAELERIEAVRAGTPPPAAPAAAADEGQLRQVEKRLRDLGYIE